MGMAAPHSAGSKTKAQDTRRACRSSVLGFCLASPRPSVMGGANWATCGGTCSRQRHPLTTLPSLHAAQGAGQNTRQGCRGGSPHLFEVTTSAVSSRGSVYAERSRLHPPSWSG